MNTLTNAPARGLEVKPVRLWPAGLIAGVAFLGAALELFLPDGPYAEGRPARMMIEGLGLPAILTTVLTTLVRIWVSGAVFIPVAGAGTAVGALLLAALNWRRMGQPHKYVIFLLLALTVATLPRAKLFSEGIYFGNVIVALEHAGLGLYLLAQQRADIERFRLSKTDAGAVRPANWAQAALIALFGVVIQSALSYFGLWLVLQTNVLLGGGAK